MNPTANQLTIKQPAWMRVALMVLLALVVVFLASAAFAKPPADRGGGNGGGGGGSDAGGYQPNVRLLCRAALTDGGNSRVRPAVAPDGTVYVVDSRLTLHAFDPADCNTTTKEWAAKWTVPEAGSKGVDVSADGTTIYTGTGSWVKAFRSSGDPTPIWTFIQDPRAFILVDVAAGPDGNVYGVASSGIGIFALNSTTGEKIWNIPEPYGRPIVTHSEIAFGPSSDGGYQLGFAANGHVKVVRTRDGSQVFFLGGGLYPPRVSPLDGTWHITNKAYSMDGELQWAFDSGDIEGYITPALASDGTHYTVGQFGNAYAIDPAGMERWRVPLEEMGNQVDVDPTNSVLLLNATGTTTQPMALQALSAANGRRLWRMEIPPDSLGRDQHVGANAAFSAGGDAAYVITAVASTDRDRPIAFLNLVSTDPSLPAASTVLRSNDIIIEVLSKRRRSSVTGVVTVVDESGSTISGATVSATWSLPDNSTESQTVDTGGGGQASFQISPTINGMYRLTVTDISKGEDYRFDPQHSVLTAFEYW